MADDQPKQTPPASGGDGPSKNEEFDPSKINEHVKKLSHKLPTGHQPYKVVVRESNFDERETGGTTSWAACLGLVITLNHSSQSKKAVFDQYCEDEQVEGCWVT
jgi:hypothetical protein